MIVVNFKTYKEATGYKAIELATICKRVMDETSIRVVAVPQLADLRNCVETGADCWVQHVDPVVPGRNTGWVTVEDVEEMGARGTLLNHAEHKLDIKVLEKTMELISGMVFEACICADSQEEAAKIIGLGPDFVAYEPPELIGNKDKSVASEKPETIKQIVFSTQVAVLIGAGVHSPEDVKAGLSMGAKGILLATDVVLAEDPEVELRKLAEAFK
jgi:triosephosphate isomerase